MDSSERTASERLVSRADLALWSGLHERHPLVGLFHRFGGVRRLNLAYDRLAHLGASGFIDQVFDHKNMLKLMKQGWETVGESFQHIWKAVLFWQL